MFFLFNEKLLLLLMETDHTMRESGFNDLNYKGPCHLMFLFFREHTVTFELLILISLSTNLRQT
jgi:hypothetical protein